MSEESTERLHDYSDETVAASEALALARIVDSTDKLAEMERLRREHGELAAIQAVLAAATEGDSLQATLEAALEKVLEILDAEAGAMMVRQASPGAPLVVASRGVSRALVAELQQDPGGAFVDYASASDESLLVADVAESDLPEGLRGERLRSLVAAPLLAGGMSIGALLAGRRQEPRFSLADAALLGAIAGHAGATLRAAVLREEAVARAGRLEALHRALRLIAEAATAGAALNATVRAAAELTGSPAALAFVSDETGATLNAAAAHGLSGSVWRELRLRAEEQPLAGPLLDPLYVADLAGDSPLAATLADQFPELCSLVAVPLRQRDNRIGLLVALKSVARGYSEDDIAALSALADAAGTAVGRLAELEAAQSKAQRASVLGELGKLTVGGGEWELLLKSLSPQIRKLIKHDFLSLALQEKEGQTLEVAAIYRDGRPAVAGGTRTKIGDAAAGWVIDNRRPLVRQSIEQESSYAWDGLLMAWGLRSDVTVPLLAPEGTIGALALASEEQGQYDERDAELLQEIGAYVARTVGQALQLRQATTNLRELQALREVVQHFSADLDLDSLLQKILLAAEDLLQAGGGAVAILDDDGIARVRASHNQPLLKPGDEVEPGVGLLGQGLATRQPVLVHNLGEGGKEREGTLSSLALPVWWQDKLIGVLALRARQGGRRFETAEVEKLRLLASHAAIAIENARLFAQSKTLAIAEERNRLARDLHDTIAQSLTGVVLELESLGDLLDSRPAEARQELEEALAMSRRALEDVRQSVWALQPTPLKSMTLDQAIEREMRALARQANLATSLSVKGEAQALPGDVETALFRIAQEALSNVRKHAAAKAVQGILQFSDQAATLVIEDDGVGFANPGGTTPTGGFGLTSMRERARQLGGELRVESTPGVGTRLIAAIPYRAVAPAAPPIPLEKAVWAAVPADDAIKVLVADDHPIARQGIRRMLEQHEDVAVIGEAVDGVEAVALSQELQPDVVLMDLQMPRLSGVEAIEQLREQSPGAKVLIISTYDKDEFLFDGIKAGAKGYLLKDVGAEALVEAVRAVSRGESLLQGVVAGKLVDRLGRLARGEGGEELTEREMEVLRLLASGARNKEIARQLSIAEKTVKFHVANIFRKLGASSRTEALAIALERGLLHR